jgi:hypothetical protein
MSPALHYYGTMLEVHSTAAPSHNPHPTLELRDGDLFRETTYKKKRKKKNEVTMSV